VGASGEWKNANQGHTAGHAGRNFGNQPVYAEGDEMVGDRLRDDANPAKDAKAGGVHVTRGGREEDPTR
jgi:hypothetical protein